MNDQTPVTGGLLPTMRSRRDFSATRTFGAPSRALLPREYDIEGEKGDVNGPRSQEEMFCTAYAVSELGADEHGVPMDAHFQAAMTGLLAGEPILNGADMRTAIRSGRTFGFLPVEHCPLHSDSKAGRKVAREFIGDWRNWVPLEKFTKIASQYRMPAFFKIDGPYDHFDNVRAHLYAQRPDNGIAIGIPWYESFNDTPRSGLVPEPRGSYGWHAVSVKGYRRYGKNQEREVIRVRSWDGKRFGADSYALFTRERFNKLMSTHGAIGFMYKDVPDDLIQSLKEQRFDLQGIVLDLISRALIRLRYGI